jgi:hypothetical protein
MRADESLALLGTSNSRQLPCLQLEKPSPSSSELNRNASSSRMLSATPPPLPVNSSRAVDSLDTSKRHVRTLSDHNSLQEPSAKRCRVDTNSEFASRLIERALHSDSFATDIAGSPSFPSVWDSTKLPRDIDLQAAIPAGRLHAEGKRIENVFQALSASQSQRVAKNRLFNSKIRNLPERISFLLLRYGSMHFDIIYTALRTLPDTAYISRSQIDKVLENASLTNIRDSRPWPVCSLRGRPVILSGPVAQVRFTERQLNQKDMPGWDPNFVETLSLPILPLQKTPSLPYKD